jgi:hypothetical protein
MFRLVAHLELAFERLDVDVRGAGFGGPVDQLVDELYHRGFAGQLLQLLDVIEVLRGDDIRSGAAVRAGLAVVQLLERILDFGRDAQARHHVLAATELQGIDDIVIERVGHHHGQGVVILVEDQCFVLLKEALGDHGAVRPLVRVVGAVDEFQPELVRQAFGDVLLRDEAEFHEDGANTLPLLLLFLQAERAVDIGGFEFSTVDEQSAQGRLLFLAYGY